MVARLGGDEFAILMPGEADGDVHGSAVALAVRILSALLEPLRLAEVELRPAGSIGIAIGQGSSSSLLREADVAMYEAKRAGRGRHASFEPSMQEAASQRLAGIADLREALGRDQFHLLYQPIVDLRTRELRATEALVRWNHPTRGLVSPAEFIPLAEQTGLIVGIGAWVLRTACRQAAHWQSARPDANRSMTVNLSTRQLLEPDLVDQVRAALTESGLPPEMLVLEITESAVMADAGAASARLEDLRRLGVRLAIDDFGTGHSSLAYLRELPVHDLKIAREFVAEMETSPHDLALARGILALGHSLGLRVIAEGIETEGQDALLRGMGCDLGQGFLYARPLAASAVAPLIAAPVEAPQLGGFVATMAPGAAHLAYEPVDPGDSTALPA
jgi:EAL domain-containing protein (putative c-di-GMP-specific phosphodiesterase class I)